MKTIFKILLVITVFIFSLTSVKSQIADTVILGFGDISDFQVSPNGKYFASCSEFGIFIWDANNFELLKKVWDDYTDEPEIVWSHDGNKIATNGLKGSIKIFDVKNEEFSNIIKDNRGKKYGINWSPDDTKLACTNDDSTITVWNINNNQLFYFVKDSQWINDLKWSPDGAYISFVERDTNIKVIDALSGKLRKIVNYKGKIFWDYKWRPDGKSIVTFNNGLILWNIDNNDNKILDTNYYNPEIDFSPDGHKIIASRGSQVDNKNNLILWDVDKSLPVDTLINDGDLISEVKWSPDGSSIASSDYNGLIKIWNAEDGSLFATFQKQIDDMIHLAWNTEGTLLFSYCTNYIGDNTIRIWDIASKTNIHTIYEHAISPNQIIWSLDSKKIMNFNFGLQEWDAETGELIKVIDLGDKQGLCFSPDRKKIACKTKDKIVILDAATLDEIDSFYEYRNVDNAKWSPDCTKLGYVGDDSSLTIWDINKNIMLNYLRIGVQEISDFAWHPDNRTIAISFGEFPIYIWDTIGDSLITNLYNIYKGTWYTYYSPEYSLDGKYLAVCNIGNLYIIETDYYKKPIVVNNSIPHFYGYVLSNDWYPDGSKIAASLDNNFVNVWEQPDWKLLISFDNHRSRVSKVKWSPDGTKLASSSIDGTNIIWTLKPTSVFDKRNILDKNSNISINFNPITNQIELKVNEDRNKQIKVLIFNYNGQIVINENLNCQVGINFYNISCFDLNTGIYFYCIYNNFKPISGKFIIYK